MPSSFQVLTASSTDSCSEVKDSWHLGRQMSEVRMEDGIGEDCVGAQTQDGMILPCHSLLGDMCSSQPLWALVSLFIKKGDDWYLVCLTVPGCLEDNTFESAL